MLRLGERQPADLFESMPMCSALNFSELHLRSQVLAEGVWPQGPAIGEGIIELTPEAARNCAPCASE